MAGAGAGCATGGFNVLVDLCGIFKKISVHEVRDVVRRHFGAGRFDYVYHIAPGDGGDRVLAVDSDGDVQFDEEFYGHLQQRHGATLREKLFFFLDNRNVIGKDVPFQLDFHGRYGAPAHPTAACTKALHVHVHARVGPCRLAALHVLGRATYGYRPYYLRLQACRSSRARSCWPTMSMISPRFGRPWVAAVR